MKNTRLSPAGHFIYTGKEGTRDNVEIDTRMCCHCGANFASKPGIWTPHSQKKVRRGFCMNCNSHTCGKFECDPCVPVEKKVLLESLTAVNVPVLWTG
jgi:hypothetical protein